MALVRSRFDGKLHGKTIYDFTRSLDYNLEQFDRVKLVAQILYPDGALDDYLQEYLDTYYKVGVASGTLGDPLTHEINVFQELDKIANYILYSPDAERITKKTKYNFYTEEQLEKKMRREKSIDEMVDKADTGDEFDRNIYDEVIDFLIRSGTNYKKEVKQVIYADDLKDPELKCLSDYQIAMDKMQVKLNKLKVLEENKSLQNRLIAQIRYMRDDQLMIKDMIKGTIYFKAILPDSCEIDYDQFDFFDKEHVMALLKIKPRVDLSDDLGCLLHDLNVLIHKCQLSDLELEILKLYREDDSTFESIADTKGTTKQNIYSMLQKICDKVIYAYENAYEDWYYLNIVKAHYKKCSRCRKIKIANERHFRKREDSKDGFRNNCRKCETSAKNG